MAKAIHSMIRVLNEQRSVDFYDRAFGLKVSHRLDFEAFTLVYLRNDETSFELELTVNKDRSDPYDLGDGYGHIAFVVEDLDAESTWLREEIYGDYRELITSDVTATNRFSERIWELS